MTPAELGPPADPDAPGWPDAQRLYKLVISTLGSPELDPGQAVLSASGTWRGQRSRPSAILALGKAAMPMVNAARRRFGKDLPGMCVALDPSGYGDTALIRLRGDHPFPSQMSKRAARRVRAFLRGIGRRDHLLVLLSGGSSALIELPVHGLPLGRLNDAMAHLWAAGANVCEVNLVRRHLSRVKGGRLAQVAAPAGMTVWMLSDVVAPTNLPIEVEIGSGPFATDPSTVDDAHKVLVDMGLADHPAATRLRECPPVTFPVTHRVLLDNASMRTAMANAGSEAGFTPTVLETPQVGDPEAVAKTLVDAAAKLPAGGLLVAGGEVTPKVPIDSPPGGRCQHLAFLCAQALERAGIAATVLCCGSDGHDGASDAMGAWTDETALQRVRDAGIEPDQAVAEFNTHHALVTIGSVLPRRPTENNLADLYLVLRR